MLGISRRGKPGKIDMEPAEWTFGRVASTTNQIKPVVLSFHVALLQLIPQPRAKAGFWRSPGPDSYPSPLDIVTCPCSLVPHDQRRDAGVGKKLSKPL